MSERKYVIIVGDGMADLPISELGGKTPLEAARTPNMDMIAKEGVTGLAGTVPPGMAPGSDTANLAIFGYNPEKYYTGRAPLEAINMGIKLGERDVAFRCNLVTIEDGLMADFSAHHIDTNLTRIVIDELNEKLISKEKNLELYSGVSYRNAFIWRDYPYVDIADTVPPHDIQGEIVDKYFPTGDGSGKLLELMEKSKEIIATSQKIKDAMSRYSGKPTSAWLWGAGRRPSMDTLKNRFGLYGYTISAVDLIHGIGRAAGLEPKIVPGTTGYIDTNYSGKASAALEVLDSCNFVFVHVESPDESGHEGNLEHKLQSIEDFDEKVVGPIFQGLKKFEDYTVLLMPDHPTPIKMRTHSGDPVPFAMFSSRGIGYPEGVAGNAVAYSEKDAKKAGLFVKDASTLIETMVKGSF